MAFCRTKARPVRLNFGEQGENVTRAEVGGRSVLNHVGPYSTYKVFKNVNRCETNLFLRSL